MKYLEWINTWLSQSGVDWFTLGQAVGNNPLVMGLYIAACGILSVSFTTLGVMFIATLKRSGFLSKEHKSVSIFFISFIILCGLSFASMVSAIFFPFYWIYGGVLFVTGVAALLTVIIYLKNYEALSDLPSQKTLTNLKTENELLRKKSKVLDEHLGIWTQNVGYHIQVLKNQHQNLSEELSKPVQKTSEVSTVIVDDVTKQKVLETLEKIQAELQTLTSTMK